MKKMKILLSVAMAAVMLLTMSLSVFAQGKIFVDIQEVATDTPSQIINDRTMVPVRAITEMLGYDVYWHADTRQVDVCEKGSTQPVIMMQIDSTTAYYMTESEAGENVMVEATLDSPATIVNDRTLVPLRFISEAVGYYVEYIPETGDVYLFSPEYIERHQGEDKGGEPGGTGDDGKGDGLGLAEDGKGQAPDGVNADGKGDVVPLTMEEMTYVLEQTTNSWLIMSEEEKAELVSLIARWWEDYENIIVEDLDEMVFALQHQMEQYYRNSVNDYVFYTACEIYDVDRSVYVVE